MWMLLLDDQWYVYILFHHTNIPCPFPVIGINYRSSWPASVMQGCFTVFILLNVSPCMNYQLKKTSKWLFFKAPWLALAWNTVPNSDSERCSAKVVCDIQRRMRFYYLMQECFSVLSASRSVGICVSFLCDWSPLIYSVQFVNSIEQHAQVCF